jgi:hypothetical protein
VKQPNKINPGDPRRPICPRRVAEDANAWAAKLHEERKRREESPGVQGVEVPKK